MQEERLDRPRWLLYAGIAAILFGLASLREGAAVLFFDGASRERAGHYVPFVVWLNFLAAFAYVAAGLGIARARRWGARLAAALAVVSALGLVALAVHILAGGAFELRTPIAMTLRTLFWALLGWRACTVVGCGLLHRPRLAPPIPRP